MAPVPERECSPPAASLHVPVLAREVLAWLDPQPGQTFVDGTLGGGGHARLLAERLAGRPGGTSDHAEASREPLGKHGLVLALDRDSAAVEAASQRLGGLPVLAVHASYADLPQVLAERGLGPVDGILLDLGLSSDQLADPDRGFSFQAPGPLDLRFDLQQGVPAWQLLNQLPERELADIIYRYGEERFSRRIARAIVARRRPGHVWTAAELAELVRRCVGGRRERIDPATRTFQALRIAVNDELGHLQRGLSVLPDCLRPGGRLAIISFHSLEDRLVKEAFRTDVRLQVLTKKPVRPTPAEVAENPRSRSARLRVAQRREPVD